MPKNIEPIHSMNFQQLMAALQDIQYGKLGDREVSYGSSALEKITERLTNLYNEASIKPEELQAGIHEIRQVVAKNPKIPEAFQKIQNQLENLENFLEISPFVESTTVALQKNLLDHKEQILEEHLANIEDPNEKLRIRRAIKKISPDVDLIPDLVNLLKNHPDQINSIVELILMFPPSQYAQLPEALENLPKQMKFSDCRHIMSLIPKDQRSNFLKELGPVVNEVDWMLSEDLADYNDDWIDRIKMLGWAMSHNLSTRELTQLDKFFDAIPKEQRTQTVVENLIKGLKMISPEWYGWVMINEWITNRNIPFENFNASLVQYQNLPSALQEIRNWHALVEIPPAAMEDVVDIVKRQKTSTSEMQDGFAKLCQICQFHDLDQLTTNQKEFALAKTQELVGDNTSFSQWVSYFDIVSRIPQDMWSTVEQRYNELPLAIKPPDSSNLVPKLEMYQSLSTISQEKFQQVKKTIEKAPHLNYGEIFGDFCKVLGLFASKQLTDIQVENLAKLTQAQDPTPVRARLRELRNDANKLISSEELHEVIACLIPHLNELPRGDLRAKAIWVLTYCPRDLRTPEMIAYIVKNVACKQVDVLQKMVEFENAEMSQNPNLNREVVQAERSEFFKNFLIRNQQINTLLEGIEADETTRQALEFYLVNIPSNQRSEIVALAKEVLDKFSTAEERLNLIITLGLTSPQKYQEVLHIIKNEQDPSKGLLPNLFTAHADIKEASFQYCMRVLENVSFKFSAETVKGMASIILNNLDNRGIDEDDPIAITATWMYTILPDDYRSDPMNPYTFHKNLLETLAKDKMVDIHPETGVVGKFPVTWNLGEIRAKTQRPKLTFADLPKDVDPHSLLDIFNGIEKRLQAQAPALEKQLNILKADEERLNQEIAALEAPLAQDGKTENELQQMNESLQKAKDELQQVRESLNKVEVPLDWLKTCQTLRKELLSQALLNELINASGEPGELIENSLLHLYCVLKSIHTESDERGSEALSPREARLMAILIFINACSTGQRDGLAICYNGLPPQFRIDKASEGLTTAQTALEKFVDAAYQIEAHQTFTDTAFLQLMTGREGTIDQESHQTQFLRNRWGDQVGDVRTVEFDLHSRIIYNELLETTPETAVSNYFSYYMPEKGAKRLQESINAAFAENIEMKANFEEEAKKTGKKEKFVDNGVNYSNLAEVIESAVPEEQKEGWGERCFILDEEDYSPKGITEEGAAMLFAAFNYLTLETDWKKLFENFHDEALLASIYETVDLIPDSDRKLEAIKCIRSLFEVFHASVLKEALRELPPEKRADTLIVCAPLLLKDNLIDVADYFKVAAALPPEHMSAGMIAMIASIPSEHRTPETIQSYIPLLKPYIDQSIYVSGSALDLFFSLPQEARTPERLESLFRIFVQWQLKYDPFDSWSASQKVDLIDAFSKLMDENTSLDFSAVISILQSYCLETDFTSKFIGDIVKLADFVQVSSKDEVWIDIRNTLLELTDNQKVRMTERFVSALNYFNEVDTEARAYLFATFLLFPEDQLNETLFDALGKVFHACSEKPSLLFSILRTNTPKDRPEVILTFAALVENNNDRKEIFTILNLVSDSSSKERSELAELAKPAPNGGHVSAALEAILLIPHNQRSSSLLDDLTSICRHLSSGAQARLLQAIEDLPKNSREEIVKVSLPLLKKLHLARQDLQMLFKQAELVLKLMPEAKNDPDIIGLIFRLSEDELTIERLQAIADFLKGIPLTGRNKIYELFHSIGTKHCLEVLIALKPILDKASPTVRRYLFYLSGRMDVFKEPATATQVFQHLANLFPEIQSPENQTRIFKILNRCDYDQLANVVAETKEADPSDIDSFAEILEDAVARHS